MKRLIGILFSIIFLAPAWQAQTVHIHLPLDSLQLGDQRELTIEAEHPEGQVLIWPDLFTGLPEQMTVIDKGHPDSLPSDGRTIHYVQTIRFGFYREGKAVFPAFAFQFQLPDGDTLTIHSEELPFEVLGPDVDLDQPFMDIASPMEPPLHWKEFRWLYLGLGELIIAMVIILLLRKWWLARKNRPVEVPVTPPLPPDAEALKSLEQLEKEGAWKNPDQNKYYENLSRILKHYILGRFGLNAPDMDSTEILQQMPVIFPDENRVFELKQWLHEADLVKFAKVKVREEIAHQALQNLKQWILDTRNQDENQTP